MFSCFPSYSSDVMVSQKKVNMRMSLTFQWVVAYFIKGGYNVLCYGGNILHCMNSHERKPGTHSFFSSWLLSYRIRWRTFYSIHRISLFWFWPGLIWRGIRIWCAIDGVGSGVVWARVICLCVWAVCVHCAVLVWFGLDWAGWCGWCGMVFWGNVWLIRDESLYDNNTQGH